MQRRLLATVPRHLVGRRAKRNSAWIVVRDCGTPRRVLLIDFYSASVVSRPIERIAEMLNALAELSFAHA